jgi:hypothetical protein
MSASDKRRKDKRMGQYHKLVNLDKQEVVDPHEIGLFSKQYEHTGVEGSLADAIYLLVMSSPASGGGDWPLTDVSGRWCGDRVVVVGDYTQPDAIPNYRPDSGDSSTLYSDADSWTDISPSVREAFSKVFPITYKFEERSVGKESWVNVYRVSVD